MPSRTQPSVGPELHLLELRDLLHEHGDAHQWLPDRVELLTIVSGCRDRRAPWKPVKPSSSTPRAPRSGSARARWPAGTRPICSGSCCATMIERNDLDPALVDDVVGGCVTQAGEQGCNVTRNAWVAARAAVERSRDERRPAVRLVAAGRALRRAGRDRGRVRHRDRVRRRVDDPRADVVERARRHRAVQPRLPREHEQHARHPVLGRAGARRQVGHHARGDGRVRAASRHRRAAANTDNGFFARRDRARADQGRETGELTGETLERRRGHPARAARWRSSASLPPAWESDDQPAPDITAGNSSQMTDGASAMLIAERSVAERLGLPIRARFAHFAVAAEDPVLVLSAPVPGHLQADGAHGHEARRVGRGGVQRGVRVDRADVAEGVRLPDGALQPARRRDRDRPPARRDRASR